MFVFAIVTTPSPSLHEPDNQLPKKYNEISDVFDKVKANTLPEHRPYDCSIYFEPRKEPLWGSIYNLSPVQLETLREYNNKSLANGFIRHSRSHVGAPIFFIKKKMGLFGWLWIIEG